MSLWSFRPWKDKTAAAALVGGLTLAFEETFAPPRDPIAIVSEDRRAEPAGPVLFFHPDVPEATLVLLR